MGQDCASYYTSAKWSRVSNFKGRHLGFLAILCGGWLAARFAITWPPEALVNDNAGPSISSVHDNNISEKPLHMGVSPVFAKLPHCCAESTKSGPLLNAMLAAGDRISLTSAFFGPGKAAVVSQNYSKAPIATALEDVPRSERPITKTAGIAVSPDVRRRTLQAQTYAFSFWRGDETENGLAAGGQYGGGQSGIIASFALQNAGEFGQPQRLALLVRAAIAHDRLEEREIALGMRVRPIRTVPITITAERRFRNDSPDAFAVYAAGGTDDTDLPLKFKLNSFAQAGVVSGKDAGAFFDAVVRADRNIVQYSDIAFHAGAGAWAGGQRDTVRFDIGPSLRTDIAIKKVRFRINAEWRFRIAGDASPGNGPAITLSTGF